MQPLNCANCVKSQLTILYLSGVWLAGWLVERAGKWMKNHVFPDAIVMEHRVKGHNSDEMRSEQTHTISTEVLHRTEFICATELLDFLRVDLNERWRRCEKPETKEIYETNND